MKATEAYQRGYATGQEEIEKEREACAKAIEDSMDEFPNNTDWSDGYIQAAKDIADGVRARGKK